jgi:hypothetical protein
LKKIEYLSPTSISLWEKNQQEFYLNYLSDNRPPRLPQTRPMSVGSAFDAFAKSYLHENLFGKGHDPRFELMAIFEAQVESQNRDWAYEAGQYCFEIYKKSGALSDFMLDLQKSVGQPRFELEVRGVVNNQRDGLSKPFGEVVFLGKPDVFYTNSHGAQVILDWKVNGYCTQASPMQGYVRIREPGKNKGHHRDAFLMSHKGVMINVAGCLENWNADWARQLTIYAWLCGEEIGGDFIVAIDQLACKSQEPAKPAIRVAEHRTRVKKEFQQSVFAKAQECWEIIHSDHIFRDMTKEESQARCDVLDGMKDALKGDSPNDQWFRETTRVH